MSSPLYFVQIHLCYPVIPHDTVWSPKLINILPLQVPGLIDECCFELPYILVGLKLSGYNLKVIQALLGKMRIF